MSVPIARANVFTYFISFKFILSSGDLIPFDSIPSISKFGPITRSARPMERMVSPLSFAALQHPGMHQSSSPVLNAAAAAAVAAQLSLEGSDSRGPPNNGAARLQEMDKIDEEIHQLDRRINRVYEEEALKQKLADVEAEIQRFELGSNSRQPVSVISSGADINFSKSDQDRGITTTAGLLGAVGGGFGQDTTRNLDTTAAGRGFRGPANDDDDDFERRRPQQQSNMPHHQDDLSLARQMMFDQQMLAVARQMMELQQQGASYGVDQNMGPFQSLNLYQGFRGGGGSDVDSLRSHRTPSLASMDSSLLEGSSGLRTGASTPRNANGRLPSEGNYDNFSASEQRQWQRLQRQFDDSETGNPENDGAPPEFSLPFQPETGSS